MVTPDLVSSRRGWLNSAVPPAVIYAQTSRRKAKLDAWVGDCPVADGEVSDTLPLGVVVELREKPEPRLERAP